MARLLLFYVNFILSSCFMSYQSMLLSHVEGDISLGVSLGKCIIKVGRHFFDVNKDVVNTRYKRKMAFEIAKFGMDLKSNKNWTMYFAEISFLHKIFHCYDKNYLLEVGNYEDAVEAFQIMKELNCWNPNQRILIFSSTLYDNQTAQFLHMISITHKQLLSNVVVMIPTKRGQLDFQIYYWDSRDNEKCVQKSKFPHFFTCSFGNVSAVHEDRKQSSTCSLTVKAIVMPPFVIYKTTDPFLHSVHTPVKKLLGGLEIELTNLISKSLNIDFKYFVSTKEDWGRSFFNGSTTKSMQDLTTRRVDLVIGSLTISLSRYLLFRTSIPYTEEYLVCCLPYVGHFDMWTIILDASSLNVYIATYLMYAFLTLVIWVSARLNKRELQIYKGSSVLFYTFAAIIGNAITSLPRTRRVRVFFSMLIIFQLFYVAFYQSLLTSVLSTLTFDQEVKTIEDILKRNMSIYTQQENHRYFEFNPNKIGRSILEHWIDCENTTKCLEDVYKSEKLAICVGKNTKDYILQNNRRQGRPPLYCLKKKFISYPVVMVMRKSLPFREKIDEIIGRTLSSGLVNKWTSSMFYNNKKDFSTLPEALSGILRFSHLKPVFFLVCIGLSFALFVLVAEKMYHRSWPILID